MARCWMLEVYKKGYLHIEENVILKVVSLFWYFNILKDYCIYIQLHSTTMTLQLQ